MVEETKWLCIAMCVVFGGLFLGMAIDSYNDNQCKIAAVQRGMTADDIVKLCKGK